MRSDTVVGWGDPDLLMWALDQNSALPKPLWALDQTDLTKTLPYRHRFGHLTKLPHLTNSRKLPAVARLTKDFGGGTK